jgi:hypothetical protein
MTASGPTSTRKINVVTTASSSLSHKCISAHTEAEAEGANMGAKSGERNLFKGEGSTYSRDDLMSQL